MLITQAIENLLNGVSQAPVTQRDASQVQEQINGLSHPTRGLRKRPPTEHVAKVVTDATGFEDAYEFDFGRSRSERYGVVVANGDLKVFDLLSGAQQTVLFPNGKAYIAPSVRGFRHVIVGDQAVLVNKDVITAKDVGQKSPDVTPQALLVVRSADYGTTYTVILNGSKVAIALPSSGDVGADSAKATEAVASSLLTALFVSGAGGLFTFTQVGSSVHMQRNDGADFTLAASDGLGDDALLAIKDTVQSFELLPKTAVEGMVVKVVGDPESPADDYYVEYTDGVWRETIKPGTLIALDPATMPFSLTYSGAVLDEACVRKTPATDATTGALNSYPHGWQNFNGNPRDENDNQTLSLHNGYFETTTSGAETDGTVRQVTVMFDIDVGLLDPSLNVVVKAQDNSTGVFVDRASSTYYGSTGGFFNETLTYSFALTAGSKIRLVLVYSGGATANPPALLTGHGKNNSAGPGILLEKGAGSFITLEPDGYFPAESSVTVIVDGISFTHNVGTTDESSSAVATALALLIDAHATYSSTAIGDIVLVQNVVTGVRPVLSGSLTNFPTTRFWNHTLALVPSALIGLTIKNITDGSSGIITANTASTITAVLSGGADNTFSDGDECAVVSTGAYFVFAQSPWEDRTVGDDTSAPFPSFVGRAIDEVFFTANRFGFTSRENILLSESGEPFSLFRTTVTQLPVSDPIDVKAAAKSVASYDSALPWADGLYLITESGDIARLSGDPLTPQTVRLDFLGNYENAASVRPVGDDKNLFLASTKNGSTRIGVAARVALSSTSDDSVDITDITRHVPTYLAGSPLALVMDSNAKLLFVLTDGGARRSLYVCSYAFTRDGDPTQLSWSRWDFAIGSTLIAVNIINGALTLLFKRTDGAFLESLTLDPESVLSLLIGDGTALGDGAYNGSGLLI
jgi:hypothetical protein